MTLPPPVVAPNTGHLPTPPARPGAALTSDFDTFLRLLTTQIRHQDPLNPMESTEFATQLATFSGVEQQVRTNDLLSGLLARQGESDLARLAGWVGMEARSTAPVHLDGAPVTLDIAAPPGADHAELVVIDPHGVEVGRLPVSTQAGIIEWTGTTTRGASLPHGDYQLMLESSAAGEILALEPVEHYARVTEAHLRPGGEVVLILAGGTTATTAEITGVRQSF